MIELKGIVGADVMAEDFKNELSQFAGEDVTINMSSEGGSVSEGLEIYNALMAHEGKVTVHVDVLAASIASVIMAAADTVIVNSNAKVMIHRAWTVAMGNSKDFRSTANLLEMLDQDIAEVYAERTGTPADEWLAMMDKETWMTAAQAKESGLADEVYEVKRDRESRKKQGNTKKRAEISYAKVEARASALRVQAHVKREG